MRLNKFVAQASGLSRRAADSAIEQGRVTVNGAGATTGQNADSQDVVKLDGRVLQPPAQIVTIVVLNKPVGYVVSRDGQGNKTIYDLLPPEFRQLKPVGRLDKNSSGLLLLTNDGQLAYKLTHPKYQKTKIYEVALNKPLAPLHRQMINDHGIRLDDGLSQLTLERLTEGDDRRWRVQMHEGRNRQIRRTFAALGYDVQKLHRTHFGAYMLNKLQTGEHQQL